MILVLWEFQKFCSPARYLASTIHRISISEIIIEPNTKTAPLYLERNAKQGRGAVQKDKAYIAYLAGRSKLGDRVSLGALIQHFSPRLFAHAYRLLGHREEAKDAVQEAWVEIMRGLPKLREDTAFLAWAYRITSRRCARQIDRNVKERSLEADMPDDAFEDAPSVRAAIERLNPVQAATIRLFYIEEMSVNEVAVAMDVPEGTVKSRLSAARTELKNHLKG